MSEILYNSWCDFEKTDKNKKLHDRQDSNLRGQRPMDFKSIPLTTPARSYFPFVHFFAPIN